MKAVCMPINHLHDPAVILSLHSTSTNQTAPHLNHPPSHLRRQLTHPWPIRLIIHLFLQVLQFCFWPPSAELKNQLCPFGHCTRSIKSALSKEHLPHYQHLLLQIETSGPPTFNNWGPTACPFTNWCMVDIFLILNQMLKLFHITHRGK